jgi:predicted transcriptional regulator
VGVIIPDNGRYRPNKYKQVEYPLPKAIINDIENTTLTVREICKKHGIGETSFKRVLGAHYNYDMQRRAIDIITMKNRQRSEQKRNELRERHRNEVKCFLDTTAMTIAEIAQIMKLPFNTLYDIINDLHYDTDARGRRIRIERMGRDPSEKQPDPIDAPMCAISREWLGKPWRTTP